MSRAIGWQAGIGYAVVFGLVINPIQQVKAGWTGSMNGIGYGWCSVNVTSSKAGNSLSASDPTDNSPSASMPPTYGYRDNNVLPDGSSAFTVSQVLGSAGYVWQANTAGYDGDSTDNCDIECRVNITPADCAHLSMTNFSEVSTDGKCGTFTVNFAASAGTGLLLRGFEYTNGTPMSLEDLTNHSLVKFDILLLGPFTNNGCGLVIPWCAESGTNNMYFTVDGVAKSNPFTVTCRDKAFKCADPVVYPTPTTTGGCGKVQYSYDPTPDNLPLGVIAPVTVTATDQIGNKVTCTFQVDTTAKAFTVTYTNVVFGCFDSLTYPPPQITGGCGTFTYSYSPAADALVDGVPTNVTATVTDTINNISVVSHFTATRNSLTFNGFLSPIGAIGGSCVAPVATISKSVNSTIPVKFEVFCEGSPLTTGTPTLSIVSCATGSPVNGGGPPQVVADIWHFNVPAKGLTTGTYQIMVTLQDGTTVETVYVAVVK
jgi:hypothetical protein